MSAHGSEYLARCAEAATAQGLDPVVEALGAAGMAVEVEQTGGMVMVACVYIADRTRWVGVTDDREGSGGYLVCVYGAGASAGEQDGEVLTYDADLEDLAVWVRAGLLTDPA
ncbi:MAG: hypothetical protein ACYCST_09995 [Acidimicrobiales bacterium]